MAALLSPSPSIRAPDPSSALDYRYFPDEQIINTTESGEGRERRTWVRDEERDERDRESVGTRDGDSEAQGPRAGSSDFPGIQMEPSHQSLALTKWTWLRSIARLI